MSHMLAEMHIMLNILDEGTLSGVIATLKFRHPSISDKKLKQRAREVLCNWTDDRFEYWADWHGLDKATTASAV
jgi:hypothetical protein